MWQAVVNDLQNWEGLKVFAFLAIVGVMSGYFVGFALIALDAIVKKWVKRKI